MKVNTAIKILAILYGIAGAYTGYTIVHNMRVKKWLKRDVEKINNYVAELAKNCTNKMSLNEFEKMGKDDPKDPLDPTVIYIYD